MYRYASLVILVLAACKPEPQPGTAQPPTFDAPDVGVDAQVVWESDVAPSARGIALDAATGRVAVVQGDGVLTFVDPASGEETSVEVDIWDATDLAALDNGRFIVTIPGDGLVLDVMTASATQHFCYEPGFMMEENWELTEAVAVDTTGDGRIYASPQTFEGSQAIAASIGVWDLEMGGQPIAWYPLPWPEFAPGGMVVDGSQGLLLGYGSQLLSYRLGGEVEGYLDLAPLGVSEIRGLAMGEDGDLWVLDGERVAQLRDWR